MNGIEEANPREPHGKGRASQPLSCLADVANSRGSVHLQLAVAFAQEIFNGAKVLLIHREMFLEFRTEPLSIEPG